MELLAFAALGVGLGMVILGVFGTGMWLVDRVVLWWSIGRTGRNAPTAQRKDTRP